MLGATLALGSVQFVSAIYPALYAEQFPTRSGTPVSALSFAVANLLFSAPAPMIAAAVSSAGGPQAVRWLTVGLLTISGVVAATIRDRNRATWHPSASFRPLRTSTPPGETTARAA